MTALKARKSKAGQMGKARNPPLADRGTHLQQTVTQRLRLFQIGSIDPLSEQP
jgi:hypothetical protein